jgi:hypothetical protein
MLRTALGLGIVAVLLAATGCRMCSHPYDYCGPVYHDNGCQSCSLHDRAGSILAAAPMQNASPELARRQVQGKTISRASLQNQVREDIRSGDVPGSEQIVSVTDRVVESSAGSTETPQMAEDSSAEPKQLPSKGWTARRPTPEIVR